MEKPTLNASQSDSQILVESEVAELARCKVTQIRRWAKTGDFPAPRQIGAHKYWLKSDVLDFLFGVGTRAKNSSRKPQ